MRTPPRRIATRAVGFAVLVTAVTTVVAPGAGGNTRADAYVPPIKHVFVINIENKGYAQTWGPGSAAPYLAQTLRAKGVLANSYYATAHNSQPNYVAQISGQGPNPQMQGDCQIYSRFVQAGTAPPGQAVGTGCVFPTAVTSLPNQLDARGLTWKGYLEDMGTPCRHPVLNAKDSTQAAKVGDQYAARHNPFVYFSRITNSAECAQRVVDLNQLTHDLVSVATTPNLSYITPNLCNDGHDSPCVDGRPGGLNSVNTWLKAWVPKILASPAYRADGEVIITADESDGPQADAGACCGEGPSVNSPLPGIAGPGGGVVGALVLSHWTKPGTWSTTPYNHYSLLASLEDVFRLPYLGYAQTPALNRFGLDIYNGWNTQPAPAGH